MNAIRHAGVRFAPFLACVVFVAILAPYHDLVPFWDSREYAECVVNAAVRGFDPFKLNCIGHPTVLYMSLLWVGQVLSPGSTAALLVVNALLGCLAIFSFHRIARRLIPAEERESSPLPGLTTLAFALHPVFLAGAAFLNPDYGVAVFFLATAAFLLEGRLAGAVVAGTFAVWSKQPGVVVYTILVSAFAFCRLLATEGPWRRTAASSKRLLWLLLPTASFALYPFLKHFRLIGLPFFEAGGRPGLLASALSVGSHRVLLGYLILIFVLNVAWLPSLIALAGFAKWLVDVRFRVLSAVRRGAIGSELFCDRLVVALAFVASTLVLTRFQTYLNARYFMPLYPLLLLCTLVGIHQLTGRRAIQCLAMGTVCLAFSLSIWRTTDPVSRAIFGTFEFGDHQMLRMTSLTGECCGFGRDQLVYSLEFAQFHYVMDEMLPALTAAPRPVAVAWQDVNWHFFGPLDRRTGRRTLRRTGTDRFEVLPSVPVVQGKIALDRLLLLEFPNFVEESPLRRLLPRYDVVSWTWYGRSGYRAAVLQLEAKSAQPPAPAGR
jgi:hypothetical protein